MTTVQVAVAYTSHLESCEFHSPPLFVRFVVFLKEEPQDIHFKTIFFSKKKKKKKKKQFMQPKGSSEAFFVKLLENFTLGCDFSYLIFL